MSSTDSASCRWDIYATKLSTPRYMHSMISIDDDSQIILTTGGRDSHGNTLKDVELLDLKNKTKKSLTDMVSSRFGHSSVILNNYIYLIGGFCNKSVHRFNISEIKNPSISFLSNNWETNAIPDMDKERFCAATVVHNDYIYVLGGLGFGVSSSCIRYQISPSSSSSSATQNWEAITTMKTKRYNHSAVNIGSKIYIIGGLTKGEFSGFEKLDSMEIYDTSSNEFEDGPRLPVPLCDMRAFSIGFYIVVTGGVTTGRVARPNGEINDKTFLFDTNQQKWQTIIDSPSLNVPRCYPAATVLGNKNIIICGGRNGPRADDGYLDTIEYISFEELLHGKRWDRRKKYITLRSLVDCGKASEKNNINPEKERIEDEKEEFERSCFQHLFKNSDDDVFRIVMQFL